ncbi:hypothetical protein DJ84_22015 [Halorubrum ezzemoulense]|nr:hypothetical protein DJ84_22015 [Halorubrum ezzemoulense]
MAVLFFVVRFIMVLSHRIVRALEVFRSHQGIHAVSKEYLVATVRVRHCSRELRVHGIRLSVVRTVFLEVECRARDVGFGL